MGEVTYRKQGLPVVSTGQLSNRRDGSSDTVRHLPRTTRRTRGPEALPSRDRRGGCSNRVGEPGRFVYRRPSRSPVIVHGRERVPRADRVDGVEIVAGVTGCPVEGGGDRAGTAADDEDDLRFRRSLFVGERLRRDRRVLCVRNDHAKPPRWTRSSSGLRSLGCSRSCRSSGSVSGGARSPIATIAWTSNSSGTFSSSAARS